MSNVPTSGEIMDRLGLPRTIRVEAGSYPGPNYDVELTLDAVRGRPRVTEMRAMSREGERVAIGRWRNIPMGALEARAVRDLVREAGELSPYFDVDTPGGFVLDEDARRLGGQGLRSDDAVKLIAHLAFLGRITHMASASDIAHLVGISLTQVQHCQTRARILGYTEALR